MNTLRFNIAKALLLGLVISISNMQNIMAKEKITQTAGHAQLGEFAPKFADLNDDVLFGKCGTGRG